MFKKAKWIWLKDEEKEDEYASFIDEFSYSSGKVILNICAEINYIAYINEQRVGFGQFPNYLKEKYVDVLDVTQYCQPGKNTLRIVARYEGINTLTHIKDKAGVIFEITENNNVVVYSSKRTLGGYDCAYVQHACRLVTTQMGYSVNMINESEDIIYQPCRECERLCTFLKRPVEKLINKEVIWGTRLDIDNKVIFDFNEEISGHIILNTECEKPTLIKISYGEHLADGEVRQLIDGRDFSFEFQCYSGDNYFELLFFRISGRYIEVKDNEFMRNVKVGIMPVLYPTKVRENKLESLDKKIYEICVRTLQLCMHEHYEDCPWREQALYVLDSRNQMLAGYYAFENSAFARANIVFMSKGKTTDGLLELTFPATETPAIPFFSLMYPVLINEYIKYTKDLTILEEVMPTTMTIMNKFIGLIDSTGLIQNFTKPYWNFYEWSLGSACSEEDGTPILDTQEGKYDLILNCAFIYAFERYKELCQMAGIAIEIDIPAMKGAIKKMFYDESKGFYYLSNKGRKIYGQLGNAFAKLVGLSGKNIDEAIKGKSNVVPATLSMLGFVYDALLDGSEQMMQYVLSDIREKYGYMLRQGATTFWETLEGEAAFHNAGSLCHGWSAMPIYYYSILCR